MKVAILGCGPSALVAAHAIVNEIDDAEIYIFSQKRKSPIFGAQYLHQPIPGVPINAGSEPRVIQYVMAGSPEDYLKKVYGDAWDGTVNDDLLDQAHIAWDLRGAYEWLWNEYEHAITDVTFRKDREELANTLFEIHLGVDIIINTIPRERLCVNPGHVFKSVDIWAAGDSEFGTSPILGRDNIIEYNGTADASYYRVSRMFEHSTVEWPGHIRKPSLPGVAPVRKPLGHNCDCWPPLRHLGRMGRWQNGRLVHHCYADAVEMIRLEQREIA